VQKAIDCYNAGASVLHIHMRDPLKPPRNHAHGMRDFDVSDPDGNQLTFGMAMRSASGAAANE
jgi:beta-keto acid cleavage enzyme